MSEKIINIIITLVPLLISIIGTLATYFFTFGKRANQIDSLLEDVKDLKKSLIQASKDLVRVQTQLEFCLPAIKKNPFAEAHSPISLTAKGEDMRIKIKADDILNKHKEELYKSLPANLNNAYDIQNEAFKIVREKLFNLLVPDEMLALKNAAYQEGTAIDAFLIIFQILFRNDILKTKNIPITDVDKFDPNKKA
ncbi:MAG: hypothetical protein ACI352_03135 [Elusimicrobiaceae bacterium]